MADPQISQPYIDAVDDAVAFDVRRDDGSTFTASTADGAPAAEPAALKYAKWLMFR